MEGTEQTAAQVLGETCRALRGSIKTEAMARAVTDAGLNWTTARVAHLEAGKVSPTITTLLVLRRAFSALLDRPVALSDLFAGDGCIELGSNVIDVAELRDALNGEPITLSDQPDRGAAADAARAMADYAAEVASWPKPLQAMPSGRVRHTVATWLESDDRAVAGLDVTRSRALAEMAHLWGRSLSAERDSLAGNDANQQQRGRISRNLLAQLRESINSWQQ